MRILITSSVWTLVFVFIVGLGRGWTQTPPTPAPTPAVTAPAASGKALSAAQVQQATTIRVQAVQLDKEAADASRELEAAAVKLAQVRARQQALNRQAFAVAPSFVAALGGVAGVDFFDFTTQALRVRPTPKAEGSVPPAAPKN